MAIAPSDPKRLYATLAATAGGKLNVYRSDDAGETWAQITDDPRPAGRLVAAILPIPRVDPKNPDIVYSASIVTMRSTDGGKTWMGFRGAPGGDDYQNIWINPDNRDIILLVSDQGAIITVNRRRELEFVVQPADGAALSRRSPTIHFLIACAPGSRRAARCASRAAATTGRSRFATGIRWAVIEYGYVAPDPLASGCDLRRRQDGGLEISLLHRASAEHHSDSGANARVSRRTHGAY